LPLSEHEQSLFDQIERDSKFKKNRIRLFLLWYKGQKQGKRALVVMAFFALALAIACFAALVAAVTLN